MYPFAILNSFGNSIQALFYKFADGLNHRIFPLLKSTISDEMRLDDSILEFLEKLRIEYGDTINQSELQRLIGHNLTLLDSWTTGTINKSLEQSRQELFVNGISEKDIDRRVPLIPRTDPLSNEKIPLAGKNQRLLQNKAYADHFNDVEGILNNGILRGRSSEEITKDILVKTDMNAKRARFWAEDQMALFQAEQTRIKAIRSGYTHYRWKAGLKARESHAIHRNNIYSWKQGVDNLTRPGARNPGEDYRCHCIAEIVVPEELSKVGISPLVPDRQPQSTRGLVINYSGSETTRVEKGKRLIESLGKNVIRLIDLAKNKLRTQAGRKLNGTPKEILDARNIISNLERHLGSLESKEGLIGGSPLEIAILENLDNTFKIILGGKNYVDLPPNITGLRISHNHPENTPPSLDDIRVFLENNLKEMRVVSGLNRKTYVVLNQQEIRVDFKKFELDYIKFYEDAKRITKLDFKDSLIDANQMKVRTNFVRLKMALNENRLQIIEELWTRSR